MKKAVSAVVCVALIAGLFAMLNSGKNKRMAALAESKNVSMEVPVRLYAIEEQNLGRRVKINGVVSAKSQVTVLAEAAGQVKRFYKEVGDVVYQDTPLALVDATIVSTQLETARANLENSKRDLERFQNIAKIGAATQQTVDNLRLAVESAKTNVTLLEKQLNNTTIKSPQKGVVARRMVEVGSVVVSGSPTFIVADLSEMIMRVGLTEKEIVYAKQGMPVKARVDAINRDFDAVVHSIGITADMNGRYSVEALITDQAAKELLRPDLAGSVAFELPSMENAVIIPRNALVSGVKDPKVYVVKDGTAKIRQIVLKGVDGKNAIVQEGLVFGEQIVIVGHQNLYENVKVRAIQ